MYPRTEMLDLIVIDGKARGIVTRNLVTGEIDTHIADAWCWARAATATCSTFRRTPKARTSRRCWRAHKRGALFANPCFTQIHPTCIPVSGEYQSKLTLMSESLRNDGRIWVPKKKGDKRPPDQIPEAGARLLPGAPVSELRQPGAARRGFAQCQGCVRRRAAASARRARRVPRFRRRDPPPGHARRSKSATATCSICTSGSRTKIRTSVPMRIYPGHSLHDGRPVGGLSPDEHDPGAVRDWARLISPTMARTGWARAR